MRRDGVQVEWDSSEGVFDNATALTLDSKKSTTAITKSDTIISVEETLTKDSEQEKRKAVLPSRTAIRTSPRKNNHSKKIYKE